MPLSESPEHSGDEIACIYERLDQIPFFPDGFRIETKCGVMKVKKGTGRISIYVSLPGDRVARLVIEPEGVSFFPDHRKGKLPTEVTAREVIESLETALETERIAEETADRVAECLKSES